jgi:hypothetical protein
MRTINGLFAGFSRVQHSCACTTGGSRHRRLPAVAGGFWTTGRGPRPKLGAAWARGELERRRLDFRLSAPGPENAPICRRLARRPTRRVCQGQRVRARATASEVAYTPMIATNAAPLRGTSWGVRPGSIAPGRSAPPRCPSASMRTLKESSRNSFGSSAGRYSGSPRADLRRRDARARSCWLSPCALSLLLAPGYGARRVRRDRSEHATQGAC